MVPKRNDGKNTVFGLWRFPRSQSAVEGGIKKFRNSKINRKSEGNLEWITIICLVRPACKVNGKGRIFTPNDIKIPKIFQIWNWHPWLRPRDLHQCKLSFQSIQRGFSPDSWNIKVLWLFSWLVTWLYCNFFSRARAQIEPVDGFSRLLAHTTCFRPRTVLWGLRQYRNSFQGNIHQKFLQKGRE